MTIQQGWQCPKCRTIHAPFIPSCKVCSVAEQLIQSKLQGHKPSMAILDDTEAGTSQLQALLDDPVVFANHYAEVTRPTDATHPNKKSDITFE